MLKVYTITSSIANMVFPLDAWDSGVYYYAGKIAGSGEEGILLTLASGEDSVLVFLNT